MSDVPCQIHKHYQTPLNASLPHYRRQQKQAQERKSGKSGTSSSTGLEMVLDEREEGANARWKMRMVDGRKRKDARCADKMSTMHGEASRLGGGVWNWNALEMECVMNRV